MRALVLVLACLFLGCPSPQPVPPVPDASAVDASTPDGGAFDTYDCASWCKHAGEMHCPAALPTDHGATCVEVCANMLGTEVALNLQCRTLASSCATADECEGSALARRRPDAGNVEALVPATCANWCAHATQLHCKAATKTPAGSPCVDVCNNVMSGPPPVRFNLRCRINAKSCTVADACESH